MKKQSFTRIILGAMLGAVPLFASGQAMFSTKEYLDVNRFKAIHMVHGDMWWDPATAQPGCEYPQGTGKHASFLGSLFITGVDPSNDLHAAAVTYRLEASDYWPGPLDAMGACTYTESEKWARIWKINRSDVNHFLALTTRTVTTIPAVILEWPAKGNVNAKGNGGAALAIAEDMAPFIDTDHDGIYDPLKGDYPDMKGDQMLWWVINDNTADHLSSKGQPFKIQIHISAYAYNRGTAVDRMLFYEYDVVNKSVLQYKNFRLAFYSDADLGNPSDDVIAFDSTHRVGLEYNANGFDMPNGANSYGLHPPMTGLSLVEMPGDHYPDAMIPAGTFNYYERTASGSRREPNDALSYYNYLNGLMFDGIADPAVEGNYAYDLKSGTSCMKPMADRRYILSANDYTFDAGTKAHYAFVFVATDTNGNDCNALNTTELTDLTDSAWKVYYAPLPALGIHDPVAAGQQLKVYPNPATDKLFLQLPGNAMSGEWAIFDMTGRKVTLPATNAGNQIVVDVRALSPGIYTLSWLNGPDQYRTTFTRLHD